MTLPPRIKRNSGKVGEGKRSPSHRAWIRGHQCCVSGCAGRPIECAHVNTAGNSGMGMKASDAFTVSLCRDHHAEAHRGEETFEAAHKLNLMALAEAFYRASPHRSKLVDPFS
jgi:hypothetical protein